MPTPAKKYAFKAVIHEATGGGAFVLFPHDVEAEFGTRGRVPVKVTFDGVPGTGSLMKYGYPQHLLGVSKAIREQIGKAPGDTVRVKLSKDDAVRNVDIPPEFKARMRREKLLEFFETLSYTHRKEYCRWITEAKKEETRLRRLDKALALLRQGVKTPG